MEMNEAIEIIYESTGYLLCKCDGAISEDGMGYNKYDSMKVNRVYQLNKSVFRARTLGKILIKYHRQLDMVLVKTSLDIVETYIKSIPVPKKVAVVNKDHVTFKTPFNRDFIDFCKQHGARYNPDNKTWNVPLRNAQMVYDVAVDIYRSVEVIGDIPKPEEVPFGEVVFENNKFFFYTEYDSDLIDDMKSLGGSWDPPSKRWVLTVRTEDDIQPMIDLIQQWDIEPVNGAVKELLQMEESINNKIKDSMSTGSDFHVPVPEGLELYPFQIAGIKYIENNNGRGLIGDQMGLGKTVQFIGFLNIHPEIKKTLVIVPAFLKINWKRESKKWLLNRTVGIIDAKNNDWSNDVTIINYEIVQKHLITIMEQKFDLLGLDECHYAKNYKAQRTQSIIKLQESIRYLIALSGTPLLNRPLEVFNTIKMIDPFLFPSFVKFAERYTNVNRTRFGTQYTGARNQEELGKILRSKIMVRRLKKDVLAELPEKIRNTVFIKPKNMKDYNLASSNFVKWLKDNIKDPAKIEKSLTAETLVRINTLRKLIGVAKLPEIKSWLTELNDATTGKIVVFTVHRDMCESIATEMNALWFDGSVPTSKRQEIVDKFINDSEERILVTTIGAGGVGLNLQVAETVVITELPWRPADMTQAEDRIHRIGQTKQTMSYITVAEDTIDEHMVELLNEKSKIIDEILDGTTSTEQKSMTRELIKRMLRSGTRI